MRKKNKLVWKTTIGKLPISLIQNGVYRYSVVYGKQATTGWNYAEACKELGACIMHALAASNKLELDEYTEANL